VLIDPGVIARGDAAVQALGIEAQRVGNAQHHPFSVDQCQQRVVFVGPTFRALIAGGVGAVQRTLAFAPVEAPEMAAAERYPHHPLLPMSAPHGLDLSTDRVFGSEKASIPGGVDDGRGRPRMVALVESRHSHQLSARGK
jgi:hypothetical protein